MSEAAMLRHEIRLLRKEMAHQYKRAEAWKNAAEDAIEYWECFGPKCTREGCKRTRYLFELAWRLDDK